MSTPFGRTLTCVAFAVSVDVSASSALADALTRVNLQWQAPPTCPDASFVKAQLRRDLEGSQAPGEAMEVRAVVERGEGDEWRALIRTQSSSGVSDRLLAARSCEALADATSLIVAMQIDPETAAIHARAIDGLSEPAAGAAPPSASSGGPQVVYPGRVVSPPVTSAHRGAAASETKTKEENPEARLWTRDAARPRVRGMLAASVQRDWGSLPSASEIFAGALGVIYGPWWGEFGLGVSSSEDIARTSGPSIGSVRVLMPALRACWRAWEGPAVGMSPCIGFEWARWSSEGNSNLNAQRDDSVMASAASLRWLGSLKFSDDWRLIVPVDVVVPLSRPRFGFVQATERQVVVFTPSWIALRAGVGVQLYFP
jgi:hypothetical protein